jgi:dCTP diphosphatase
MTMSDLAKLQERIVAFRDARDWKQFHNPKDLSISLLLEAAEVLEHFQWKTLEEQTKHVTEKKQEVSEELADTLYWVLLLAHESKYPVEKARGNHKKYTELT